MPPRPTELSWSETGEPICKRCQKNPARKHPTVGWYKLCQLCRDQSAPVKRMGSTFNNPLCHCGRAKKPSAAFCSSNCRQEAVKARWLAHKLFVIASLGGRCVCLQPTCPAHEGHCLIDSPILLTVEHTLRDGHKARHGHLSGRLSHVCPWSRYRRALAVPGHGMVLLCFNCHQWTEARRRDYAKSC